MIEIKNLNKTYDNKNKALKNINIHIEQGEFVFIMGRSGSGKSTLMKILLKEVEPTSGQVIVNDMELGKMPRRYVPKYRKMLGVVFQDFRLLKHMTVYENVAFAQRVLGLPVRKIKENLSNDDTNGNDGSDSHTTRDQLLHDDPPLKLVCGWWA